MIKQFSIRTNKLLSTRGFFTTNISHMPLAIARRKRILHINTTSQVQHYRMASSMGSQAKVLTARYKINGGRSAHTRFPGGSHYKEIAGKDLALLVSVGKDNFKGDRLKAVMGLIISEAVYNHKALQLSPITCDIIVTDELQRFNIATAKGILPEQAREEAHKHGTDWIIEFNRLEDEFHSLVDHRSSIKFQIVRWKELTTEHNKFYEYLAAVRRLRIECPKYEEYLRESAVKYRRNKHNKGNLDNSVNNEDNQAHPHDISFLEEENSVFGVLSNYWANKDKIIMIYPGDFTPTLIETIKHKDLVDGCFDPLVINRFNHKIVNHKEHQEFSEKILNKTFLLDAEVRKKFLDTAVYDVAIHLGLISPESKDVILQHSDSSMNRFFEKKTRDLGQVLEITRNCSISSSF